MGKRITGIVLAIFFLSSSAWGTPITYVFEGVLTNGGSLGELEINTGDRWAVSYTFDTNTYLNAGTPSIGQFPLISASYFSLTTSSGTYFTSGLGSGSNQVVHYNNTFGPTDMVDAVAYQYSYFTNGFLLHSFGITIRDGDLGLTNIPPRMTSNGSFYDISGIDSLYYGFTMMNPTSHEYVEFMGSSGLTSLRVIEGPGSMGLVAPVPEPATILLFGTGFAGLAAARRRKKIC